MGNEIETNSSSLRDSVEQKAIEAVCFFSANICLDSSSELDIAEVRKAVETLTNAGFKAVIKKKETEGV